MNNRSVLIAFLFSLAFIPSAYATTDIVGDVYGQVFSAMSMNGPTIPYSVSIDELNTAEDCDNDTQLCYMNGLSWSDVVGWTFWDGLALQTELGVANFPTEYIAKATYNGKLSGFIWGEKYGWVQLSACVGIDNAANCSAPGREYCTWNGTRCDINKNNRLPEVDDQTVDDWGVYIDFCPMRMDQASCESPASELNMDQYCNWDTADGVCVFDGPNNLNGHPLRGYAWSQYLGWVKFGPETGETEFAGAYTKWFPDLTPPQFEALNTDNAWIPNPDDPIRGSSGTLTWLGFADENESQIDRRPGKSSITINTDSSTLDINGDLAFTGCPTAPAGQAQGNLIMSQNGLGEVGLSMPTIGLIGAAPPYGFCKFTLGGVIYNGSGFGFFFGPEGLAAGAAKGLDLTDPVASAPNTYDPDPVTLYTRAGVMSPDDSIVTMSGNGPVADGNNYVRLTFSPKDVGMNPIVHTQTQVAPVTIPEPSSDLWVRKVQPVYDYDTDSSYYFDSLDLLRNYLSASPVPIQIENDTYNVMDDLLFPPPLLPETIVYPSSGNYLIDTIGFAPTPTDANALNLHAINTTTVNSALPAISPIQGAILAASPLTSLDDNLHMGEGLPFAYEFSPAIEVTSGVLDDDIILLGQPFRASYIYHNNSITDAIDYFSFDNLPAFEDSGGIGGEVLEFNSINLVGLAADEPANRTDLNGQATRYELLHNAGTPSDNQFHSIGFNYHLPRYDFATITDAEGVYKVKDILYVSPDNPCFPNPETCPEVLIDRSDILPETLPLDADSDGTFAFTFTPSQFIGQAFGTQVTLRIDQFLAYFAPSNRFNDPKFYALYSAFPWIEGKEVKSLGLGTTGVVSGEQVFESVSGRELESISTTSSADLRKEIRKNVASLTRNITPCSADTTLNQPPITASSCVSVDEQNKTVIAVYSGPGTLHLGGSGTVIIPDYKYSLILLDGANLRLSDNLYYGGSSNNSFGMIVMQNETGETLQDKGGNVFIDPNPTNLVGLLYAEGSILSTPDGGSTFYYGGGADSKLLKNQLYWQGSIASRNTIGGAPSRAIPAGAICTPWGNDDTLCSQAYDLDYIRRFTTKHLVPGNVDVAPSGSFFSGGGYCDPATGVDPGCVLGGVLPTTIKLTLIAPALSRSIDLTPSTGSKSLATFFIERDNRPVPPGFTSGGGLTSTSEIR